MNAKDIVKANLKLRTSLAVNIPDGTGMGGTSTTGNVCHLLFTAQRGDLAAQVPECYQEDMKELITRFWVIIKLYGSDHQIHTAAYKEFCLETEKFLLSHFRNDD